MRSRRFQTRVEGLEKLQAGRYDGIVLDVMMPRMDGYETAKQIKRLEEQGDADCDGDRQC